MNLGSNSFIADDGSDNSEMSPTLFGVQNAAGTKYSYLDKTGLNVTDSAAGDTMNLNAGGLTFPDATSQYSAAVNADWNATSGLAEILNKPTIPDAQIQSDWNQTNNVALDYIKNKPTSLPPNGTAGGDLQGSFPSPVVHRIHSYDMQSGLPSDGQTWVVVPTPFGTQPVEWRHQKLNVTQLGDSTSVGQNLVKLTNPSAISFPRINADNSVTARTPAQVLTDLGIAGTIILGRDFTGASVSNTTTNTLVFSTLIPANTLQASDFIELISQFQSSVGNGVNVSWRVYLNTTPTIGGTQIAIWSNSVGTGNTGFLRNIFVTAIGASGNIRLTGLANGVTNPYVANAAVISNVTINTTIDQYIVIAVQMGNATSTSTILGTIVKLTR